MLNWFQFCNIFLVTWEPGLATIFHKGAILGIEESKDCSFGLILECTANKDN